ncbi:hypothetical protein [Anaerobutyricum hallii]|jgi:hypothetical protein|uniref:hypothetical protein n=1 Tax=Anaerobutyricum hallii TaxID=39488 RepID=UPI00204B6049|nr:hypothetical protein [Anaerobutyricum hallii]DAJ37939.1 MAG TPA: hypothetical protein [Caudoviricetes sp.]
MTREDIITNLRYWCNNIDKPCEECKIHDICVVRDHVQTFDSMDDKKLQEYYKLMYGSEVKVEKMELVKVFKKATKIYYPDVMKDVLPLKEFVKNITDKGYKVELTKDNVVSDTVVNIYKEVEMEE